MKIRIEFRNEMTLLVLEYWTYYLLAQVPKKGQACKLLSWCKEGEAIADGRIQETDSGKNIHGMPIRFGAYIVWVDYALVDDALLYRPTSEFRFVHKAIGTTVPWPKDCKSF
ncbi:hypothetical protein MKX01_023241 [Papaver californicum]|nr:hypothetical protein MKX01_023241 [Papaver californicum]